jgi:DNA repair exonuclease SbcCD ATPase subunit
MMDLIRVYGENFCQYKTLDEQLNPGLTCILGMNGSGKSNLVRAIYLCLVGEVYGAPNLVRDGYRKGFVALDVGTPQGEFTIMRKLTHNDKTRGTKIQHELTAEWIDTPLSKKADVADFLAPFLAVTPQSLQYISFALQGDFGSLMSCDHMFRAKIINTLMGMDRAEKLRVMLKDSMSTIADMPDRSDLMEFAEKNVEAHTADLALAQKTLESAKAQITDAVRSTYTQALVVMERPLNTTKQQELLKLDHDQEDNEAKLLIVEKRIKELESLISDTKEPDHETALEFFKWKSSKEEVDRCNADLKRLSIPMTPSDDWYDRCTEEVRVKVQTAREEANKINDKVVAYGTGVCGSCGQKLPGDIDIEKLKAEHEEAEDSYKSLEKDYLKAHKVVNEYKTEKDNYDRDYERLNNRRKEAVANSVELSDVSFFDEEEYKKQAEAYSQDTTHRKELMIQQTKRNGLKDVISKIVIDKAKIEAVITATPQQQAQAQAMIKAFEAAEEKVTELTREVSSCDYNVKIAEDRLKTYQEDMKKGAANIATREILSQARDKLHVEQLPRLAAQSSIQAINRAMKKYLDMFAFPYGFRLNEKLDFVVDFDMSTDHPAGILSGGEEVRAAMAMRFALMDVFSAGCGVLIIDEPTTALDKEAIGALIEVLETAAIYFKSRNVKIICPTHDQQLAAISDSLKIIGEIA